MYFGHSVPTISQQAPLSARSAREGLHLSEVVRGGGVDDIGLHEKGRVVVGPQVPIGGQHLVAAHRDNHQKSPRHLD